MGCACFTSKQIGEIYAKYSDKMDEKERKLSFFKKMLLKLSDAGVFVVLVNSIPLMFLYVSLELLKGNNMMSLSDFFNLTADVKQEY